MNNKLSEETERAIEAHLNHMAADLLANNDGDLSLPLLMFLGGVDAAMNAPEWARAVYNFAFEDLPPTGHEIWNVVPIEVRDD